jgi:hypothetical protein
MMPLAGQQYSGRLTGLPLMLGERSSGSTGRAPVRGAASRPGWGN